MKGRSVTVSDVPGGGEVTETFVTSGIVASPSSVSGYSDIGNGELCKQIFGKLPYRNSRPYSLCNSTRAGVPQRPGQPQLSPCLLYRKAGTVTAVCKKPPSSQDLGCQSN